MLQLQQLMRGMTKSLLAGLVALALVLSILSTGFAHETATSCLPSSNNTAASDSAATKPTAANAFTLEKVDRFDTSEHRSKGGGDQSQFKCCDNWCPSLFLAMGQISANVADLHDVRGAVPSESLNSAYGGGLERPPKSFSAI
jgi:hypothetical protein